MDSDITAAVKQATDYQINKKILRERILSDLHFVCEDGMFLASCELISFLNCWHEDQIVLEDVYGNPILVNRSQLLTQCKQHYTMAMNSWHMQHHELKKIRKI
jgi:hypothetical protein